MKQKILCETLMKDHLTRIILLQIRIERKKNQSANWQHLIFKWYFFCLKEIIQPRNYRTVTSGIPEVINHENGSIEASSSCQKSPKTENVNGNSPRSELGSSCQPPLLTRQAIRTYKSDNRLIQYKYSSYGGLSQDLPR